MRSSSGGRTRSSLVRVGLVLGGVAAAVLVATTMRTGNAEVPATPAEIASSSPRVDTPLVADGEVLAIGKVGDLVILGGNFSGASNAGAATVVAQPFLLAYDINTGLIDEGWRPVLDGEVNAIAVEDDQSTVFIGGSFGTIDGAAHANLGAIQAASGDVDALFTVTVNKTVRALAVFGDRLYVGGKFGQINGLQRKRLAAVDFKNDSVDESFDVVVDEGTGAGGGSSVRALEVTPDGKTLMSVHNSRLVGGQVRTGVALIDLTGPQATVRPWFTDLYELNRCGEVGVTRVRDGAIAPDGSYFVVVSSGQDFPPGCDTAVAFPIAGDGKVEPLWVSRHFDTMESVEITWNAVYVGGHFLFQEAPGSPDPWPGEPGVFYGMGGAEVLGDQVIASEKLGALNPYNGKALDWPAAANGQRGVFEILAVDGWLLMGHDGDLIAQLPIGRHGAFALPDQPPGTSVIRPAGTPVDPPPADPPPVDPPPVDPPPVDPPPADPVEPGYWLGETDGDLYAFGGAVAVADVGSTVVDIATDLDGGGLWVLGVDGRVSPRGTAVSFGDLDLGSLQAGEVPSAISVRPAGDGYWIFTNRGRAVAFGAAPDAGDVSELTLDGPVVASVATPSGLGYWMIGSDGGVFAFGDAKFRGSTGGMSLDAPVVGMAPDPDGDGYWLVAGDGGVFAYSAPFNGSVPGYLPPVQLQAPIVAMVSYGSGYVMLGSDGGAFSFSELAFLGSLGANPPNTPVVAIAAFG